MINPRLFHIFSFFRHPGQKYKSTNVQKKTKLQNYKTSKTTKLQNNKSARVQEYREYKSKECKGKIVEEYRSTQV